MSDSRQRKKPWTLTWVHMGLALAVGAGAPLLWAWLAPAAEDLAPVGASGAAPLERAAVVAMVQPAAAASPAPPSQPESLSQARQQQQAAPARQMIPRVRDPNGDQSPDITDFINNGEVPSIAEVISRLRAAGVTSGLAAFNAPGTRPPLVGNAVPADAALPPGYVRHHQFTDDGRPIEPILMYAPDHPLLAAAGLDPTRPQDRVVPAAAVPPGLPVRQVVVPPSTSGDASSGANDAGSEPRR